MTTKELLKRLRRLGAATTTITHGSINCGGCGAYAVIVADRLEQLGYAPEIAVFGYRGDDAHHACAEGNCRHVMVRLTTRAGRKWLVDATGCYPAATRVADWGRINGTVEPDEMRDSVRKPDNWNPMFNRRLLPKIKAAADSLLLT